MEVNGGLTAESRCNRVAPAGGVRAQFGYYRLFSNSNVRGFRDSINYTGGYDFWGTDANAIIASGGPLYRLVTEGAGSVVLTATIAP